MSQPAINQPPAKPSFREAFAFWLKLGFISFGGPAGQIAIMHEFLVEKRRWISDARFLHGLNYCMVLPGPEAQQLATYIGWLLHGVRGGLAAGILFILPSVFILLALSIGYVLYGNMPWVVAVFYGVKPAIIAVILVAFLRIGKKSLLSPFHYGVAILSFICIYFLQISFPLIIIGALVAGMVLQWLFPSWLKHFKSSAKAATEESGYYLNTSSPQVEEGLSFRAVLLKSVLGLILWIIPFLAFQMLREDYAFWHALTGFFTKAALVTFGGAYAVLPYVAQESVEKLHWLSQYEMMDGLALGETTPGPLIMILVFVGFVAGYHHGGGSLYDGTLGLLTTTYYTFLPCFLFIFIGAPFIERSKENNRLRSLLSVVTAAVVGVMLNLAIYFGKAVLFPGDEPDVFSLLWLIISFLALYRFKINMIAWIFLSAAAGAIYGLIVPVFFF